MKIGTEIRTELDRLTDSSFKEKGNKVDEHIQVYKSNDMVKMLNNINIIQFDDNKIKQGIFSPRDKIPVKKLMKKDVMPLFNYGVEYSTKEEDLDNCRDEMFNMINYLYKNKKDGKIRVCIEGVTTVQYCLDHSLIDDNLMGLNYVEKCNSIGLLSKNGTVFCATSTS